MQNEHSIRVSNNLIKITVNDQGEYIQFSAADTSFYTRFTELLYWISDEAEKFKQEKTAGKDAQSVLETIRVWNRTSEECLKKIDEMFGAGASRKVFGEEAIAPDIMEISDFLQQLTPIVEQVANERGQEIKVKYNRNRTGAKKNVEHTAG